MILTAAGAGLNNVDHDGLSHRPDDHDGFNHAYETAFDPPYPSRSTIEVSDPVRDSMRVEIEVVAGL